MTNPTTTETKTFTVGQIVDTGPGDYVWTFEVIARSRCFVTLRDRGDGREYRVGVKVCDWSGESAEWVLPFGSYSMAPVVRASKPEVTA